MSMPIETKQLDSGATVVALSGRLVLGREVQQMESTITELVAQGARKFIFDLRSLDYTDSSGIGCFVSCLTKIKKSSGDMRLAGANERVTRLFQLTGVDHLMPMYPSVSEAGA
jgi:anti-sigma B factor antagonist